MNKSECIIFCNSHSRIQKPDTVNLSDNNIEPKHSNFLGVVLDDQMNWYDHIVALKLKLNSALYTLLLLVQQADLPLLKTVYFSNFIAWVNSSGVSRVFVIPYFENYINSNTLSV